MGKYDHNLAAGVRPFDRDRMALVNRDDVAKAAMGALTVLQNETPEVAMGAAAVLFAVWCRRVGMDPHAAHQMATRMINPEPFHRKGNVTLEVLRDYAGLRIMGDSRVDAN